MSEKFTITRRLELDAAHRVPDHKSKCYNMHGHRYVVHAECEGRLYVAGEQRGMVMDFGFLKDCMMKAIHDPCDHASIFWMYDSIVRGSLDDGSFIINDYEQGSVAWERNGWKVVLMDDVPTAENLARLWFLRTEHEIQSWFHEYAPDGEEIPRLTQLTVHETPNCVATYRPQR